MAAITPLQTTPTYPANVRPQDNPATQSSDYQASIAAWTIIDDVLSGIDRVKSKLQIYLPQFPRESVGSYRIRLQSAPWRPEFEDSLRSLSSKPFTKQVRLNEEAPEVFIGKVVDEKTKERKGGLIDDIDGEGNSLHVFAKNVFYNGIAYGLDLIYVTFPDAGPVRTKAEEIAQGARPYWVHVRSKDVIDLKVKKVNGKLKVTHIRMIENSMEQDGFAEVLRERIRVVWLDSASGLPTWQLYLKNAKNEYVAEAPPMQFAGMEEIPIVLFFTNERHGHYRVKPPLYDLAHVQLELYRALSRKDQIMTFAGSPMLKLVGFKPPAPTIVKDRYGNTIESSPVPVVEVGPNTTIFCPAGGDGSQPDADYIQPNAANLKEVREDVDGIMEDFRRLAMQPTTPKSGDMVATGQAIDAAKAHSACEAWAMLLKDALEQAMVYTCQWMKISDTVTVSVHTDFAVDGGNADQARIVGDAQKRGVVSKKTERAELARRRILGPDFDEEQEEERLAEEGEQLEAEADIDPITGLPIKPPVAKIPEGE